MYHCHMDAKDTIMHYKVSWFDEFECLAAQCPDSCCKGWVIPLSDDDMKRFAKERGKLGIELCFATGGGLRKNFNKGSGDCPFWQKDGLCSLQKRRGHDFIPWTCQSYPRFYRNYGEFEECCLDLSCIAAARLFLKHNGAISTVMTEDEPVTAVCTTNDDKSYLDFLISQRMEMTDTVHRSFSGALCDVLFEYAKYLQDQIVTRSDSNYAQLTFSRFYREHYYMCDETGNGAVSKEARTFQARTFPLAPHILSGFLATSLWHSRLRKVSPKLYRMLADADIALRRYDKHPDAWFEAAGKECSDPLIFKTLAAYLGYYLFQYFARTYETYSFRKQVATGLCHLNMILLLTVTSPAKAAAKTPENKAETADNLAQIISVYNRRAYFNDSITDEMYRVFEDGIR